MLTVIMIILYFGVFFLDFLPNFPSGDRKGRWVYLAFFLASFTVIFLYSIDIMIPSPSPVIRMIVEKLFQVKA